jgi:hypothetical protein
MESGGIDWNQYPVEFGAILVVIAALWLAHRAMSLLERVLGVSRKRRRWGKDEPPGPNRAEGSSSGPDDGGR